MYKLWWLPLPPRRTFLRKPEESRRREFAHLGLDREDGATENTTTKPIPTLQRSLASLPPLWRAVAANSVAPETLN
jgi:hypothetical protein